MSPQPRNPDTAADVAAPAKTPKPDEDAPSFEVQRYLMEADVIFSGDAFTQADVRAALGALPPTREIAVKDARQRVKDWLGSPIQTNETPAAPEPV